MLDVYADSLSLLDLVADGSRASRPLQEFSTTRAAVRTARVLGRTSLIIDTVPCTLLLQTAVVVFSWGRYHNKGYDASMSRVCVRESVHASTTRTVPGVGIITRDMMHW